MLLRFSNVDVLGLSENLSASAGKSASIPGLVKGWADEVCKCHLYRTRSKPSSLNLNSAAYNPNNPVYSHFTQMVWKATTDLGCYVETCHNSKIFDYSKYGVCCFLLSLFMVNLYSIPT